MQRTKRVKRRPRVRFGAVKANVYVSLWRDARTRRVAVVAVPIRGWAVEIGSGWDE